MLDGLLQTSTANLERVRKMKTRHQRLQTRVVTVREELQSFLEDDDDMMKMCLTHRMEQDQLQQQQGLIRAQGLHMVYFIYTPHACWPPFLSSLV